MKTSEVQLCGVAIPVSNVSAVSTATSTNSVSQTTRTAEVGARRVHTAMASAQPA